MLAVVLVILKFQSTLPHGSDRGEASSRCRAVHFNPRSLAGATSLHRDHLQLFFISIHAPLRERRFRHAAAAAQEEISIHAPLRERPQFINDFYRISGISIHAPLRERRD